MAFSFNFKASDTQHVACYHCGGVQEVGRRAQTVTCKRCNKPLQIADVKVKGYDARRKVQTTGSVVVEKKGQVIADDVECGGLVVRGQVKAKNGVTVRGTVLLGAEAVVTGNLAAHRLAVGAGATLDGYYCVGKDHMVPPAPAFEGDPTAEVAEATS